MKKLDKFWEFQSFARNDNEKKKTRLDLLAHNELMIWNVHSKYSAVYSFLEDTVAV